MENTLDLVKSLYADSEQDVIFTDGRLQVLWMNHEDLAGALSGGSAASIFDGEIGFPLKSGTYTGKIGGASVRYRLTRTELSGETAYLIEIQSRDEILDLVSLPAVKDFIYNSSARIREAVFGICGQSKNIYTALEEAGDYEEIKSLNLQMGECYRILKSGFIPSELLKYAEDIMDEAPVLLEDVFRESKRLHAEILGRNSGFVEIECEKGLTVFCDRKRLIQAALFSELYILEKGIKRISVCVERIGGSAVVTFSGKSGEAPALEQLFSPVPEFKSGYLYILQLFCKRFKGELFFGGGELAAVGIRLPLYDGAGEESVLMSSQAEYGEDRFTPYHIALADFYEYLFY